MTIDTAHFIITTSVGDIEIALHEDVAPKTVRYVRDLIESGSFDGSTFYRSTRLGVETRLPLIQGGPLAAYYSGGADELGAVGMLDTVESTSLTGLAHVRGTVSLARDLFATGHVVPELFICLDDYPELDAGGRTEPDGLGFPAFGSITAGLEVVEAIAAQEANGVSVFERFAGEILTEPMAILRVTYQS